MYLQDAILESTKARLEADQPNDLETAISTGDCPIDEENFLASPGLWVYERPLTTVSVLNIISASGKV